MTRRAASDDRAGRPAPRGPLAPIDYTARIGYRRPPARYLRLQWLGPLATALGLSPRDVVTLEVPGRRTGRPRRTTLVRVRHGGKDHLVALAGEAEWVRNVRAAGGRGAVGRHRRRAATLVELPPAERPPVIAAYLSRSGRRPPDSRRRAGEARHYFGVSPRARASELEEVAVHYPVFRIEPARR